MQGPPLTSLRAHARAAELLDPWVIAVLAAAISAGWAGRPSLWFDEGATISASASRTLPELWKLLGHIDAVHGLYYLLMHGWFAIFPPTEFWSRFPSSLAIGGAAAGVVVFTRQFAPQVSGRATALCAGVVFAILPRVTWAGMEARSSALSVAAAVWLTVLLVAAVRRNRPRLWLLYALVLMLSILVSINLVLLVPVYAAMLPLLAPKKSRKSPVIWWAVTSAVALGAMTPFMLFAHGQVWQVNWIANLTRNLFLDVVHRQYFDHSVPFAILAGVIVVAAIVARLAGVSGLGGDTRRLLLACAAWIRHSHRCCPDLFGDRRTHLLPALPDPHRSGRGGRPGGLHRYDRPQAVAHCRCPGALRRRRVSELPTSRNAGRTPRRAGTTARSPI